MSLSKIQYDSGLVLFSRKIFNDERGSVSELYREDSPLFSLSKKFVQDNFSYSKKGALRGLHLQQSPHEQGKLITCLQGDIFDVAIDLRKESSTFKKHWVFLLKSSQGDTLYIPEGFAHGFCALTDEVLLFYKTTKYYEPSAEVILRWDDEDLGIEWPNLEKKISKKDQEGLLLRDFLRKNN